MMAPFFLFVVFFSFYTLEIMAQRVVSTVVRLGDIAYYMHPKSTVSTIAPLLIVFVLPP